MELKDALAQLRNIHAPAAVSAWPLAIGWWLLLVALLLLVVVALVLWWWRRRNAWRRAALVECRRIAKDFPRDDVAAAQWLALLRRAALAGSTDDASRRLSGDAWAQWLAKCSRTPALAEVVLRLERCAFAGEGELDRARVPEMLATALRRLPRREQQNA